MVQETVEDDGGQHLVAEHRRPEYDTTLGQFIGVDPLLMPDQPQSLNGYVYANNNPVTFSDPTGLCLDNGSGRCQPGNNSGADDDGYYDTQPDSGGTDPGPDSSGDSGTSNNGPTCFVLNCGYAGSVPVIGPTPVFLPYIPPHIASPT